MTDWKAYLRRTLPPMAEDGGRDADIVEELAQDLAEREEQARRPGATDDEARAVALSAFGDAGSLVRDVRELERPPKSPPVPPLTEPTLRSRIEGLLLDLRYAVRLLGRNPGFAAVAILTIALGIGANSAIFTVVNGVLLRPLPYPESDRLVAISSSYRGEPDTLSPPNFLDLKAQSHSLVDAAAYSSSGLTIAGRGDAVRVPGAEVSASFFNVLGIRPMLGRGFHSDDNQPGRTNVVILSHALWQERFGGDRGAVGTQVTINGHRCTIVGVMPAGFAWPQKAQAWTPLEYDEAFTTKNRGGFYLDAIGRMASTATVPAVEAEATTIAARLERQYPKSNTKVGFFVQPLHDSVVGDTRTPLLVLFAAVGLVLLIACANVANLLLARASVREGEFAVRAALGAGNTRLATQMLTESLVLSGCGAVLGMALGLGGTRLLMALAPESIARPDAMSLDTSVLLFTLFVTLSTAVLFGGLPALQLARGRLARFAFGTSRGIVGVRGGRLRSSLVVTEMALAMMLLWGAGLLFSSFVRLQHVDPGFRAEGVTTFRVPLPEGTYNTPAAQQDFFSRLTERIRSMPGVQSVGATLLAPLSGDSFNFSFRVEGRPVDPPGSEKSLETRVVTPGYFRTMFIPLLRGRLFTDSDREGTNHVVLLNATAVRRYFKGEDPIGKLIQLGWGLGDSHVGGEVVGVVGDVREYSLRQNVPPEIYVPLAQAPINIMQMMVRSANGPTPMLATGLRQAFRDLDRNLPPPELHTMQEQVSGSIARIRFVTALLLLFAVVALLLASVGVFGVMSYSVVQRRREIGIRVALGCQRGQLLRDILGRAMLLAAGGAVIGGLGSLGLGRFLASLLFETTLTDVPTLGVVTAVLLAVAAAACAVPALRATRVDATTALRME